MRLWRVLGIGAAVCVLLAALGAGAVLSLAGSERGTQWLAARAQPFVADVVRIGDVGGTLLDGLTLRDVEIVIGSDRVTIASLELAWNPRALTERTIELSEAHATEVRHRREPTGEPAAYRAFELPLTVAVGRGRIDRLELESAGPEWAIEALVFAGRWSGPRLALEDLEARVRGLDVAGRAALETSPALALESALDWRGEIQGQAAAGLLAFAGQWPRLGFEHTLIAPFPVEARGELALADPLTVRAELEWRDLAWPGIDWGSSPVGRLEIDGGFDGVRFASTGDAVVNATPITFAASGTADLERLRLDSLRLTSADGTVDAAGTFELDGRRWDATVEASDLNPAALAPEWPGRLVVRGRSTGALVPTLEWRLDQAEVQGELRGYALEGTGAVAGEPSSVTLEGVRLVSGANRVEVDGRIGTELALDVVAELEDLGVAWPGLTGELTADFAIGGTRDAPTVRGAAAGAELAYEGWSVARFDASADLAADGDGSVRVTAERVGRGAFTVNRVQGEVDGALAGHGVRITAEADEWQATAAAAGGLANGRWRGAVERLDVEQPALGPWRLAAAAPLRVGAGSLALDTSCLAQGRTQLCAELRLEGGADDALVVSAQNFELRALQPFLPPGLALDGVYQLSASFTELARAPRGSMSVVGGTTRATAVLAPEEAPLELTLDDLILTAELADWRLAVVSRIEAQAGAALDLSARMEDVRRVDSPIGGELRAALPDLGFAAVFSPDVADVGGRASVELTIGGTAADPELDGRAELLNGEISVPEWGLQVVGIEAEAVSVDGRELRFAATGRVDDRAVEVRGTTTIDPRGGWPTELVLTGDNLHAVARPDADVFVTPDLRAVVRLPDITVTGTVHVPRARIEVGQLPEQAVAPSPDAVVHGGVAAPRPARPLNMLSDILITLGSDVEYRALNLDADVAGEMRLRRVSDVALSASGSLLLDGTYNAYGQSLTLDRGQLLFTGPLDDPALDVRAVRRIEATTVGVELSGTVKAPGTRIYSDPPMSEADALSYLLFGRPLTGTGSEETATLQTAALAMGLQQALPVVQRIGQSLGLDEFSVQTTAVDAGSLMAGKYLSPNVYIRYSYGLVNRIGGLLLRFRVNERLSIETRSGEQKSMDLLYTVEKE